MNEKRTYSHKAVCRIAAILAALMLIFTGCGSTAAVAAQTDSTQASTQTTAAASLSEMFTERDLSGEYDESGAEKITLDGSSVTITEEGTYIISGTLSDGQIIVDADENAKVQIVLNGASVTSQTSAALYVKSADKVFVTLAAGTTNTLANGGSFATSDENNIDGAVFAKDDITFNGSGSLTVTSPAGHGVVGKDDVKFCGGTYTINAANHGVQANDSVRISGADITINAQTKDGIHVSDDSDETPDGYFYIADGIVTISAGDDGIHADAQLISEGGKINVTDSYEGLEALSINISGGEIDVTAKDDGLNAAGGNTSGEKTFGEDDWNGGKGGFDDGGQSGSIAISGGSVHITAGGDGVDSNGSVEISGGTTVVQGPTQGDTSVLDFNGTGTITGGVFIGTGGAGMAQNFSSVENQGLITLSVGNQSAGSAVTVKDASGNVVAEVTPELDYAVVYISTPDIVQGGSYTVTAGTYSETIQMTESVYGSLGEGMMRNGGGGGQRDMMGGKNGGRGQHGHGDMGGAPDANTGATALPGDEQGV